MRNSMSQYHMLVNLSPAERQEIKQWRKQNPHIKVGSEFAMLIMAYVRGQLPKNALHKETVPLSQAFWSDKKNRGDKNV